MTFAASPNNIEINGCRPDIPPFWHEGKPPASHAARGTFLPAVRRAMSIWNKVLLGLILVASIALFILGARALQTHKHWRNQANQLEQELATELENHAELSEQVRQVTLDLDAQLVDRGRVWYGCKPDQVAPDTGEVSVMTDLPDPHRIEPQTVLWVFDEADFKDGGRYLGQFTVTAVGGQDNRQLQLKPTMNLAGPEHQAERDRLQKSATRNGPTWALYEIMPVDNHDSLAELDPETLKTVLPAESVEEFITDGQLTTLADVKQRGLRGKVFKVDQSGQIVKQDGLEQEVQAENEKGKYVRQLRDYEELFRQFDLRRTEGIDREKSLTRNNNYLAQAHDDAKRQHQYRQKERDWLVADRQRYFGERDTVRHHLEAVQGKWAAIRAAVAETIKTNQAMAGEIARIQQEATRLIDQQTRRMAQASTGR